MFKNYGLTGQTIIVRKKHLVEPKENPRDYGERNMRADAEGLCFLLATVLLHIIPQENEPLAQYKTCIHKHNIQSGEVILDGGAIR